MFVSVSERFFPFRRHAGVAYLFAYRNAFLCDETLEYQRDTGWPLGRWALSGNESVTRLKGEGRPVIPVEGRSRVLEGLSCVDWVVSFEEDTPEALLELLKPGERAYADANMNALQAAKQLKVHPNTIYSRANKIEDLTGKNALTYHDLTELLLAVDCRED